MATPSVTIASGSTWQEVAADRQQYRDETIAAIEPAVPAIPSDMPLNVSRLPRQLLTSEETKITEMLVEDLAPALAEKRLSATTVVKAFLRRAGLAQRLTNCLTELLPERALARATYLDEYLATHEQPIGPLHGVPISVKEHIGMKDLDLNAGFVSWVGRVGDQDALVLQLLWKAGCVFFARTTQPQSLMHLETSSNLYGVTVNPFNTTLSSGGSSGGEGALVGLRGSILGIGTDIGGSIRSPAANNGLYGFKPTSYRLPLSGFSATMAGQEQIVAVTGPLSTSLEGIKLFMSTIIAGKPWLFEPSTLPFKWEDKRGLWQQGEKKLKIAVLWDDGIVAPHPPVTRALREVVDKLKAKGNVEVISWNPYGHDEAWKIIANLYFSDGAAQECAAIEASGEPYRPLTNFIIQENPYLQSHTITSLWEATARRESYRAAYAAHWNSTATLTGPSGPEDMVDMILCPVGPSAAPKIDTARYWGYTAQWNLLDYPSVVFPVSKVGEEDDVEKSYTPRNADDEYNWSLWQKYGAKGYWDAPVSLQLVGRRYEDEKTIRALEVIKDETGLPFVSYV
ncbi:MAG: hypothetical protein M1818_002941 [Claussenomyces sp. TS43310]|nr:MAG: hypothetical protein M1818_002941 [Claussenomyces sp. TS43310]